MVKRKKQTKTSPTHTTISNNVFTGVHWDAKALEAVNNVSKALLNLTELFKSQNIHIDAMIKMEGLNFGSDAKKK